MTDKAGTEGLDAELRLIVVRSHDRVGQYKQATRLLDDARPLISQHADLVSRAEALLREADALKLQIDELHERARKMMATADAEGAIDDARAEEIIAALKLLGE